MTPSRIDVIVVTTRAFFSTLVKIAVTLLFPQILVWIFVQVWARRTGWWFAQNETNILMKQIWRNTFFFRVLTRHDPLKWILRTGWIINYAQFAATTDLFRRISRCGNDLFNLTDKLIKILSELYFPWKNVDSKISFNRIRKSTVLSIPTEYFVMKILKIVFIQRITLPFYKWRKSKRVRLIWKAWKERKMWKGRKRMCSRVGKEEIKSH